MAKIMEPAREINVCREADVVVVGGGPAGIGAAVAAARSGAKTALIERYGHLGGMATGGLVNIIPNLSDISGKQRIAGITQELLDRLDAHGGASYPRREDWGTTDRKVVDYYLDANLGFFYIRKDPAMGNQERVLYTAVVDPEILKAEANEMVQEAGVDLWLHSWGTTPIMEGKTVRGVIFESKSGRQAMLGKVVIDCTGDGDLFVAAGAAFDDQLDFKRRTAYLAIVFWLANVDLKQFDEYRATHGDAYRAQMRELQELGGHPRPFKGVLRNQENVVWYHFFQPRPDGKASDAKDVRELTRVDVSARRRALITYEYMKKHIPGFQKSFIMLSSPQLGTQGGRRVLGEYTLTERDMESDEIFEDTIAVLANNDNGLISMKHPTICVPYRCLVPRDVDGLLVAGRSFSSSDTVNEFFNIIPHCLCYGQAAGTAAAMAADAGIQPRKVDYKTLRGKLVRQGVLLPEVWQRPAQPVRGQDQAANPEYPSMQRL
jgi:2-polyprenyl-6-methoxyphenol hydroxylase-like FAD-dependent oxidoreductase